MIGKIIGIVKQTLDQLGITSGGVYSAALSAVAEDVLPDADSTRSLGSSSKAWAEVHGDKVLLADNGTVSSPAVRGSSTNSGLYWTSAGRDTNIARDGSVTFAFGSANVSSKNLQPATDSTYDLGTPSAAWAEVYADAVLSNLYAGTGYGGGLTLYSAAELLSDLSSSATTSNLAPAGARIIGVSTRVKTAVVTSLATNTFSVGDGSDVDRYGANIAGAQGTTSDSTDATADPMSWSASAHGAVTLDPPGAETFSSGAVYVVVHYLAASAPTSTP